MLNTYITQNVDAGNTVAVSAHSQGTMLVTQVMSELQKEGVPADAVRFVLTGDPNNPDGGDFTRGPVDFPAFGLGNAEVDIPTPADTIYQTSIYTQEYDGFADFPKYPLNILADLNADLGMGLVHPTYRILPAAAIDDALKLPTSSGDVATSYYMIPMADDQVVPLLRPLELIPVFGKPLAALLNPDLEQLINLGYDNPANEGWDAGPADVATGFGIGPSQEQIDVALKNLGPGLQQGIQAFEKDLSAELSHPSSMFADLTSGTGTSVPEALTSPTDFINTLTQALDQIGSLGLPAWDTLLSETITVPTDVTKIFFDNLASGPLTALELAAGDYLSGSTSIEFIDLLADLETVNTVLQEFGLPGIPGLEVLTP